MLKWAVHTPRLSYLTATDANGNSVDTQLKTLVCLSPKKQNGPNQTPIAQTRTPSARRQRVKRKSPDLYLSRRLQSWLEKENQLEEQITSTPLQPNANSYARSCPLRRLNSLKDLSNIIPSESVNAACTTATPNHISSVARTPNQLLGSCKVARNNPTNYAATLPTLEVEYSPCGLVPGPILALRGLGIADTYFDKPRYLPPDHNETLLQTHSAFNTSKATNCTMQNPQSTFLSVNSARDDTQSLSSSKMGDQTLERMIDAILESTRKEKRHIKFARQFQNHQRSVMSPTYTRAEDPANDLSEFWCETRHEAPLTQPTHKKRRSLPAKMAAAEIFSEREVRSPIGARNRLRRLQDTNIFHLRRQRAVRRKRKGSKMGDKSTTDATYDIPAIVEENVSTEKLELSSKTLEDASPDSGHNSCSEPEDYSINNGIVFAPIVNALENNDSPALDATKRRLSFSNETLMASP
ncbi:uncharacterized protein [Eurosta solidaginis]|uniref:uncharacterized protein n=1 Tax=Eurosta solidaginis TaxID=178769 RepID=UPI00353087B0